MPRTAFSMKTLSKTSKNVTIVFLGFEKHTFVRESEDFLKKFKIILEKSVSSIEEGVFFHHFGITIAVHGRTGALELSMYN